MMTQEEIITIKNDFLKENTLVDLFLNCLNCLPLYSLGSSHSLCTHVFNGFFILFIVQSESYEISLVTVELIWWQWNWRGIFFVICMAELERHFVVVSPAAKNLRQVDWSDSVGVLVWPKAELRHRVVVHHGNYVDGRAKSGKFQ